MRKKISKCEEKFEEKNEESGLLPTRDCEAGYGPEKYIVTVPKRHFNWLWTPSNTRFKSILGLCMPCCMPKNTHVVSNLSSFKFLHHSCMHR